MKLFNILFLAILITGCSNITKPTIVDRSKLVVPKIENVKLEKITWKVVIDEETYYIALTPQEYEKLSRNMAELVVYIRLQNQIIEIYKKYYEQENGTEPRKTNR